MPKQEPIVVIFPMESQQPILLLISYFSPLSFFIFVTTSPLNDLITIQ